MNRSMQICALVVTTGLLAPAGAQASTSATGNASAATSFASSTTANRPLLTTEQRAFLESRDPATLREIERIMGEQSQTRAFPIAAVAIAAAAWCAKGALGSVATSALDDVANGGEPTDYVRNAIIGCIAGEVGGVVWKFLPGWVKKKAVELVAAFVIKYIR